MPELPEVEVTRRSLLPQLEGRRVTAVVLRHVGLRWPFPDNLDQTLVGHSVRSITRRSKYLLFGFDHGTLILHLGMSGRLRLLPASHPAGKHDHIDLVFGQRTLRLTDPRRFGAVLWHPAGQGPVEDHTLLSDLGPEPFDPGFTGEALYRATRKRTADIKQVLLSGKVVVGVGNIYASESLFLAGIDPRTPAQRIGRIRYARLAEAVRQVLNEAIGHGGSTLRDFTGADGQSGYFQLHGRVYDRQGLPCRVCGTTIRMIRQGGRATFYCANCQK